MNLTEILDKEFRADIEDLGYELVDIEFVKEAGENYLRFFIYSKDGITAEDCEKVSGMLDPRLDDLDLIKKSYYLEVSSPDLSRPLKTDRDLERNKDELLKVKLKNGDSFLGKISEIKEDSLVFDTEERKKTISREVGKDEIKTINIEIVF